MKTFICCVLDKKQKMKSARIYQCCRFQHTKTILSKEKIVELQLPECNFKPERYTGLPVSKIEEIRKTRINPALTTYHSKPLALSQGYKQWLFDVNGKRYLDMFGGICTISVGHSHPKITEAVYKQITSLGHVSNVYLHTKLHEYAEKLTDKFPGDLKVVYFVNSGSEANELAILMARIFTKNYDIISLRNGYHGMSNLTMNVTGQSHYKYPTLQSVGTHHVMCPDVYKGVWGGRKCRDSPVQTLRTCSCEESQCVAKDNYIKEFSEVFSYSLREAAAFIAESIQGVGGTVQLPKGYLKEAAEIVRNHGGIYIADEVQTGFGRTGDHFWGFEMHDVTPDIVTMAKGIGNGFPLGAVVTTPTIAKSLSTAAHFNTFGGNPVSCAAGLATLEVIEEEKLQENSKNVGTYLLLELKKLRSEFSIIGDVRGKGLMIGVELVEGNGTTEPLSYEKFMKFWDYCKEEGVIIGRGGLHSNVLRIKPPMCVTKSDADFCVHVLRKASEIITAH